ncbi:MAG: dienelactone hydrolase family protein, partial [Pseudomonadota bacterium]|nr:dienelactone hydrolase family protein [Pseudomonadota bacterium]
MRIARALAAACALLAVAAHAEPTPETVWIAMPEAGLAAPLRLEATLYKPTGAGRFPVVLFNHGSSGGPIPPTYTENPRALAGFLNERGIALIVPMRRGRGKSEGVNQEEPSACTVASARQGIAYAAGAVDATFAFLRAQPWADMDRLVLAGHSRGGVLAAVYAGEHPGVAKGVINFSGGWKNDTCGEQDINLALFDGAGRRAGGPAIFLYGRGDGFYADASMDNYARSYRDAGGKVDFRLYQVSGFNGHLLYRRGLPLWEHDLDGFLRAVGMVGGATAR